jgi:tRNA(fMet)-specific endonuclease VapC
MPGNYLLDTNAVIALFQEDSALLDVIRDAQAVFLSAVTVGELYYGAMKSEFTEDNLKRLEEFVRSTVTLVCDSETG